MLWTDPAVQAAVIQGVAGILATLIAAVAAAIIGKRFADRKKTESELVLATQDIAFMLAVEEAHCLKHTATSGESFKHRMREVAREKNLSWSGRYTPGRLNDSSLYQRVKLNVAAAQQG